MAFKVKLTRKKSIHNEIRTDDTAGFCEDLPKMGEIFLLKTTPLEGEGKSFRRITTSPVRAISHRGKNVMEFDTEYSTYGLEILQDNIENPFADMHEPFIVLNFD